MYIQAPWVGKTPEEYHEEITNEKQYYVTFIMRGEMPVMALNYEDAKQKVKDISKSDLADFADDIEVE